MQSLFSLVVLAVLFAAPACATADLMVIHRDTGRTTWFNSTGGPLEIAGYSLLSPLGGFRPSDWLSISDHYDADSGGSVDPIYEWNVLGSSPTNLAEATVGAAVMLEWQTIDFGAAWQPGSAEDAIFEYLDASLDQVVPGRVRFVNSVPGDYNANGIVEQADLDLVLLNWGEAALPAPPDWINDLPSGIIDQAELDGVLLNWGHVGQALAAPVPRPLVSAAVPEPGSLWLASATILLGGAWLLFTWSPANCQRVRTAANSPRGEGCR